MQTAVGSRKPSFRAVWKRSSTWLGIGLWTALCVWCVGQIRDVAELRGSVSADAGWLVDAEAFRREVALTTQTVSLADDAVGTTGMVADLAQASSLSAQAPVTGPDGDATRERWDVAMTDYLVALRAVGASAARDGRALASFVQAHVALDIATSDLIELVRRRTASASAALEERWSLLTAFAVLLLTVSAGFAFLLVYAREQQARMRTLTRQRERLGSVGLEGLRVAVVDDDPMARDILVASLSHAGCDVRTPEPADAMPALDGKADAIDLLVVDVAMPAISGPEIASRLREQRTDLPVVLMSAYGGGALPDEWRDDPRVALISKPFTTKELFEVIRGLA